MRPLVVMSGILGVIIVVSLVAMETWGGVLACCFGFCASYLNGQLYRLGAYGEVDRL